MARTSIRLGAALCLLSVALLGCEDDADDEELSCDLPQTGADVLGTWTLQARGTRTGCRDLRRNGELTLRVATPFVVDGEAVPTATETGEPPEWDADAFVYRIERADFSLEDRASEVSLSEGSVAGSCVSFRLREQLDDGDALDYQFNGYITRTGYIRGDFVGEGPERCESSGTFTVEVSGQPPRP